MAQTPWPKPHDPNPMGESQTHGPSPSPSLPRSDSLRYTERPKPIDRITYALRRWDGVPFGLPVGLTRCRTTSTSSPSSILRSATASSASGCQRTVYVRGPHDSVFASTRPCLALRQHGTAPVRVLRRRSSHAGCSLKVKDEGGYVALIKRGARSAESGQQPIEDQRLSGEVRRSLIAQAPSSDDSRCGGSSSAKAIYQVTPDRRSGGKRGGSRRW
jgi:hypothetical protein